MKLFFTFLVFLVIHCDDSADITRQEAEKATIDALKTEIKAMAAESICSEEHMCYDVGIGAKPCGGYWEYIVYSGSINMVDFLSKIDTLKEMETAYNKKYMIQSDCYVAMPPKSITCVDGKCTPVFE